MDASTAADSKWAGGALIVVATVPHPSAKHAKYVRSKNARCICMTNVRLSAREFSGNSAACLARRLKNTGLVSTASAVAQELSTGSFIDNTSFTSHTRAFNSRRHLVDVIFMCPMATTGTSGVLSSMLLTLARSLRTLLQTWSDDNTIVFGIRHFGSEDAYSLLRLTRNSTVWE